MDLELIFILENVHLKYDVCSKHSGMMSNSMCPSVYTLSPFLFSLSYIRPQVSMGTSEYQSPLYSLISRDSLK